jgi:DNA repair exonuclease SbcCD ATPase subunit
MAGTNEARKSEPKDPVLTAVHNDAGLERIKEVLLGEEMENVGRRLSDIDHKVQQAVGTMQETLSKRLESLEGFVKKEFSLLGERLKSERSERKLAVNELSAALERTEGEQATLRRQHLEESKKIVSDYLGQIKALSQAIERSLEEIRRNKLDRTQLSRTLDRITQELEHEEGPRVLPGKTA